MDTNVSLPISMPAPSYRAQEAITAIGPAKLESDCSADFVGRSKFVSFKDAYLFYIKRGNSS
jgi:hypothetical protein